MSQIVLKLLAKQPEDRYQSPRGLTDDLERCRREIEELLHRDDLDEAVREDLLAGNARRFYRLGEQTR